MQEKRTVMKHFEDFDVTGSPFEGRLDTDACTTAIGTIVSKFDMLRDTVSTAIHNMMGLNWPAGEAITSEMSFKNKTLLMCALARPLLERQVPAMILDPEVFLPELAKTCLRGEELWSRVVHSRFDNCGEVKAVARETTGKVKHDLDLNNPDHLADVCDFIFYVVDSIDQYIIGLSGERSREQVDVTDADPTLH
jgi:hypothetical protein